MDTFIAAVIWIVLGVLFIVVWWKIFDKAGLSAPLSLLMLVPIVNFFMLLYLAFSEWPILNELNELRARGLE